VIERIGPRLEGFAVGDHVLLSFASCGQCPECAAHHPSYCDHFLPLNLAGVRKAGPHIRRADGCELPGHFFGQSAFATHALASASNMVRIDKDLPLEILAPLGCGIQTGAGTVLNVLKPAPGDALVVFGVGAVGLAAVMAGVIAGCTTIIAVDRKPERLALAYELGATQGLLADATVAGQISELTGGRGVACALDTTGVMAVARTALDVLGKRGRAAYVAAPPAGTVYPVDAYTLLNSGGSVIGVVEGDVVPQDFIPRLIGYYRQGRLPLEKLVRHFPFAEINQAIAATEDGSAVKAVLVMPAAAAARRAF
jgi:aryl-alcohol dehydrogenase